MCMYICVCIYVHICVLHMYYTYMCVYIYVYRYDVILFCCKQVGNSATHDVSRPWEHYTK